MRECVHEQRRLDRVYQPHSKLTIHYTADIQQPHLPHDQAIRQAHPRKTTTIGFLRGVD